MKSRKLILKILHVFIVVSFCCHKSFSQGDLCTSATAFTVSTNSACATGTAGTTAGASNDIGTYSYCGASSASGQDVWYTFTTPASPSPPSVHNFVLTRGTAGGILQMALYTGACGALTLVQGSENCACSLHGYVNKSSREFTSNWAASTVYYLRINNSGAGGTFTLCITRGLVAPANDSCATATNINASILSTCTNVSGTTVKGNRSIASYDYSSCTGCSGSTVGQDVWYTFTTPAALSLYNFSLTRGTAGGVLQMALYSGSCAALTLVTENCACPTETYTNFSSSEFTPAWTASTVYYLRINNSNVAGTFTLCVTSGVFAAPNDLCANAIDITGNVGSPCTSVSGFTTGAIRTVPSYNYGSCSGCSGSTVGQDVWYKFTTPPSVGVYNFSLTQGTAQGNMQMAVFSGACGSLTLVPGSEGCACVSASGVVFKSSSDFTSGWLPSTTYYIRINNRGKGGTFTLCVTSVVSTAPNDLCSGAIPVPTNGTWTTGSTAGTTKTVPSYDYSPCGGSCVNNSSAGQDAWFTFTSPPSGCTTFNLTRGTATGRILFSLYTACGVPASLVPGSPNCICGADTSLDVSSSEFTSGWAASTTYYMMIVNEGASGGTFNLRITEAVPSAPNDSCGGAIAISGTNNLSTATSGCSYTSSGTDPGCFGTGASSWYSFIPTSTSMCITFNSITCNNGSQGLSYCLFKGPCGALTSAGLTAFQAPGCGGTAFSSSCGFPPVQIGVVYYLLVSGVNGSNCNYTLTLTNVLPIELLAFNAIRKAENEVLVSWATASETNNDSFTVFRSPDGHSFEEVTRVNGAGNSTHLIQYAAIDKNPWQHIISYYRLRQTDYDGNYTESGLVAVPPNAKNELEIIYFIPDIESNTISYFINSASGTSLTLRMVDMSGRVIYSRPINSPSGTLSLPELARGVYIVRLTDGEQTVFKKFLY